MLFRSHTQFLTPENARLIPVDELEPAIDPRGLAVYTERGRGEWAKLGPAQFEVLVEHLRAVHRDRDAGRLTRNDAGIATAEAFSWPNCVDHIVRALD